MELSELIDKAIKKAMLDAHPVGSYYISDDDTDPSIIFGGGRIRENIGKISLWSRPIPKSKCR